MKIAILICVSLFLFTISINAQDITAKLGGTTANETYDITDSADKVLLRVQADGKVGIGETNPSEALDVDGNIKVSGTVDGVDIATDVTANTAKETDDDDGVSEVYGAGWDSDVQAPTKNDVYDKIQSIGGGTDSDWTISGNDMYSTVSGNVGIGKSNPSSKLSVENDGTTAIYGNQISTTGSTYGVYGNSNAATGAGVKGTASATGANFGGHFSSPAMDGTGVYGQGNKYGGYFNSTAMAAGIGIYSEGSTYAGQFVGPVYANGSFRLSGTFLDKDGDVGTSGQILSSTVTGTNWIDAPSGGATEIDPTLTDDGTVTIGNGAGNVNLIYNSDGGTDASFTWDGTNDELEIIGGNVGIGTTTPSDRLDVNGNIAVSGTVDGIDIATDVTANTIKVTDDDNGVAEVYGTGWDGDGESPTKNDVYDKIESLGGGNTLDNAYDQGGAGAGRTITADNGAFNVGGVDGALFTGTYGTGTISATGPGTRMMWYPAKSAFRVGHVDGTQWDDGNIGIASIAMGNSTTASGHSSTAMGLWTTASGDFSTAMGYQTTASGDYSTAMGYRTKTNGDYSTVIGKFIEINADSDGSFMISDASQTYTAHKLSGSNRYWALFRGGYKLYTNSGATTGASLASGANSWGSASDSTKKENYLNVNGEYFLNSISKLKLGSWNYKSQNPQDFRHYGPMAQEIFYYFGKDDFGTIGNDTTLATADMDGIMMIALQALEKRTVEQAKVIKTFMKKSNEQIDMIAMLTKRIEAIENR